MICALSGDTCRSISRWQVKRLANNPDSDSCKFLARQIAFVANTNARPGCCTHLSCTPKYPDNWIIVSKTNKMCAEDRVGKKERLWKYVSKDLEPTIQSKIPVEIIKSWDTGSRSTIRVIGTCIPLFAGGLWIFVHLQCQWFSAIVMLIRKLCSALWSNNV